MDGRLLWSPLDGWLPALVSLGWMAQPVDASVGSREVAGKAGGWLDSCLIGLAVPAAEEASSYPLSSWDYSVLLPFYPSLALQPVHMVEAGLRTVPTALLLFCQGSDYL